jgi:hypothetical protein
VKGRVREEGKGGEDGGCVFYICVNMQHFTHFKKHFKKEGGVGGGIMEGMNQIDV